MSRWYGARLKKMGTLPGVPDLFFAYPKNGFHGLFIEMKKSNGVVKDHQTKIMIGLKSAGYQCVVVRTLEDFMSLIKYYLTESKMKCN